MKLNASRLKLCFMQLRIKTKTYKTR